MARYIETGYLPVANITDRSKQIQTLTRDINKVVEESATILILAHKR